LKANKSLDAEVACEFGYLNDIGEVRIDSFVKSGSQFNNVQQNVFTAIPYGGGGMKLYTVFARCFDTLG